MGFGGDECADCWDDHVIVEIVESVLNFTLGVKIWSLVVAEHIDLFSLVRNI